MFANLNLKDIAARAFKTFVQAFLAVFFAAAPVADASNIGLWKAAFLAAIAGGVSAVWNFAQSTFFPKAV